MSRTATPHPAGQPADDMDALLRAIERRYRQVAARLSPFELQQPDKVPAAPEEDLNALLDRAAPKSGLFVGYYTRQGLQEALGRYGFFARIAATLCCSPEELHLSIDTGDPFHHVLRIHHHREALLVELRLHLQEQPSEPSALPRGPGPDGAAGYVTSEWLLLQNPKATFPIYGAPLRSALPENGAPLRSTLLSARPRLPGQLHPGLGVGAEVQTLLILLCERLCRHGLLGYPAFYHTAVLYAARFRFVDPAAEGEFRALRRDAGGLALAVASWAVELGCVRDANGRIHEWVAREEILPISEAARAWLLDLAYVAACKEAEMQAHFTFDLELLERRWPAAERQAEAFGRRVYEAALSSARR